MPDATPIPLPKPERDQKIRALAKKGYSTREIAYKMNGIVSHDTVARVLATINYDDDEKSPREILSEEIRKFLDGKLTDGISRREHLYQHMYNIAANPRSMRQLDAAVALLEQGHGKLKIKEDGEGVGKRGQIQIVLVERPKDVPEQEEAPKPTPDFIEAEFIHE